MSKISVLIVDDNEVDRYLLKRQLKETKLDVAVFEKENGKEALDFFNVYDENRENHPGLFPPLVVFLDINMPLVNGFEFLSKYGPLRSKHNIEAGFIMMFSSSESPLDRKKALEFDYVKGYLTKGKFSSEELKELISSLSV